MIDTKEIRKALAIHGVDALNVNEVLDVLDRLEAAESARRDDYQNWMTALDRNAELLAKLEAAEKERDNANAAAVSIALQVGALQAECDKLCTKIAAMEKQEPMELNYIELLNSAQKSVESYVYFRRFIASTPLENDIVIWMVDFVFAQLNAKGE
jgi:predicted nuclease with TOPRIM domain